MWVLVIFFLLLGAAAAYYYLEYLPASQKKQSALDREQPGQKQITVKEPEILTQNKPSQETHPPKQAPPETDKKTAENDIIDKEYQEHE